MGHSIQTHTLFYSAVRPCVRRYCCKVLQSIPPVVNGLSEHLDCINWCKGYSLEQSSLVWACTLTCIVYRPVVICGLPAHTGNEAVCCD